MAWCLLPEFFVDHLVWLARLECLFLALVGPVFHQQLLTLLFGQVEDFFRGKVELIAEGGLKPARKSGFPVGFCGSFNGFVEAAHLGDDVF